MRLPGGKTLTAEQTKNLYDMLVKEKLYTDDSFYDAFDAVMQVMAEDGWEELPELSQADMKFLHDTLKQSVIDFTTKVVADQAIAFKDFMATLEN